MKLSQFLKRLQIEEEKTRQLLLRYPTKLARRFEKIPHRHRVHPAEPLRNRRRPKLVCRDEHIKALVEQYVEDRVNDTAGRLEFLSAVQHHLAR